MSDELSKQDRQMLNYWIELREAVFKLGLMFLESWSCEKCGAMNLFAHTGAESCKCQSCDHMHQMSAPRPPAPGEVTLANHDTSMRVLRSVFEKMQKELVPLADHEILSQPEAVRQLLARHRAAVGLEVIKMIVGTAEEIASSNAGNG